MDSNSVPSDEFVAVYHFNLENEEEASKTPIKEVLQYSFEYLLEWAESVEEQKPTLS